jgi:hypothetical protein
MKNITLTYVLAALLFTFSSGAAFAQAKVPGEGSEVFFIGGSKYSAGRYDIVVNMNMTLKYRFSSLLGDHVEKFTPKYDISSAEIYKANTKEWIFSVRLDEAFGHLVTYTGGTGNPHFTVGPDAMKKLMMTEMDFQLNTCLMNEQNRYLIRRTFPGYLRGAGRWGWDLPGSSQWRDILVYADDSKVNEAEAKRFWGKMTFTHQPTCGGRLTKAGFDVSGIMTEIVSQIPDAFSKSKGVSPAFAQMSALNAQLRKAEKSRSDGWQKRKRLTQRAWAVLKNDMTTGERKLLAAASENAPSNERAIKELDLLFSKAEGQLGSKRKKLSAATKKQLERAVAAYTPRKLASLKLPKSVQQKLQTLAGKGNDWKELVPTRDKETWLYGYKNKAGKWIIRPSFREAEPFKNARGLILRNDRTGWQFINSQGEAVGPIFNSVTQLMDKLGLACVEERSRASNKGLLNIKTGAWVVAPKNKLICGGDKDEKNSIAHTRNKTKYPNPSLWSFYGQGGEKVFEKTGKGVEIRNGQIWVIVQTRTEKITCGYRYYHTAAVYTFAGELVSNNEKYTASNRGPLCRSKG